MIALPVAVLASGLAKRLRPITEKVPTLIIKVAGAPFFSHQIRLPKKAGLLRIVLCVGHLGEKTVELYGDGSQWGIEIHYSFYVLLGDSYLSINHLAVGAYEIGKRFFEIGSYG